MYRSAARQDDRQAPGLERGGSHGLKLGAHGPLDLLGALGGAGQDPEHGLAGLDGCQSAP